jgi:hypothetical protein
LQWFGLPHANFENQKGSRRPAARPGSQNDELVASEKEGDKFIFYIRRKK